MTDVIGGHRKRISCDEAAVFDAWLRRLSVLMEEGDLQSISDVMEPHAYWKDILAFTWGHRTFSGREQVYKALMDTRLEIKPKNFRISPTRTPPRQVRRSGSAMIEAFFDFDTAVGSGTGFVRLLIDPDQPENSKAQLLLTTLQQIAGFEERIGDRRPTGIEYSTNFAGDNWLDKRRIDQAYENRNPQVLIVGAAQSGLILAARLRTRGIDVLVVEKLPRVGDVWRRRYHSLTLHNEVWANSLPYMSFPPTWPTFVPKDKLAGWLEYYAEAMELNVWTSTEFVGGEYDAEKRTWIARLKRADGTIRTLTVPQLVLATGGVSGVPHIPSLPGIDAFDGDVIHSSKFQSGLAYSGKRAIVVGTGTSGHDIAQELYSNGARAVTMVQRSPTCVISLVPSGTMVYALYSEGPPPEDIDLITASIPYPVLQQSYQGLTKKTCELDRELLAGLKSAGFEVEFGSDNTGFHMLYLRRGGGYYLNVGCSDLIASKKIGIVQNRNVDQVMANGLRMKDGQVVEADVIILATGFANQQEGVRRLLGDEVAERVGLIWGFDENNTMRNMWKRTPQERLWIMGGSFIDARLNSTFLALEIIADLYGIRSADAGSAAGNECHVS